MFCNKNKIKLGDFEGLRECVKSFMKEKRYIHTLGVEEEAAKIAGIFGCGADFVKKLKSAAILHDITKEFTREKQLEICGKYNIKLTKDDMMTEKEWHAKTGAYIAKKEFCADDIVFSAVYNHTLGGPPSAPLSDKIIYLADWIEPNRDYQDCVDVREYFYTKINEAKSLKEKYGILDETISFSMDKSIRALLADNLFIHKNTIKYRNSYITALQNKQNNQNNQNNQNTQSNINKSVL